MTRFKLLVFAAAAGLALTPTGEARDRWTACSTKNTA
jgi:hypothetical protein